MGTMGERIKAARIARGETMNKLATRARVPCASIAAVERGHYGMPAWKIKRLAAALGCTVAWLQTGVDESPLCAEVATIPIEDIQRLIETGRAVGFDETADRVEKWLKESVGSDIPF